MTSSTLAHSFAAGDNATPSERSMMELRRATKVGRYVVLDVLRNRWVIAYAVFFMAATDLLLRLGGTGPRTLVSLLNLVLLLIPLVTIVFVTLYWHGQREFNEILLCQPITRTTLFVGLFGGVVLPLVVAFVLGVSVPLLARGVIGTESRATLGLLLVVGVMLTAVFGALAVLIAGQVTDRLKGLALALGVWLILAIAWDALMLSVAMTFPARTVGPALLTLTFANPVDLARVLMVLHFDIAALMGATGAVFSTTLGGGRGVLTALGALGVWVLVPVLFALRAFNRRDF